MRSHDGAEKVQQGLTKCHAQPKSWDLMHEHSSHSAPGALRGGHRCTDATRSTRSTPALRRGRHIDASMAPQVHASPGSSPSSTPMGKRLSDSVARGAAGAAARGHREREHRDSAPIGSHKFVLQKALSRTIDDTRSLQDKYEDVLRKAPASRTLEELQLLVGWARQIEFKDEEVKKAVKFELLCRAMRLQVTELDELVCKQGDEVRGCHTLVAWHLARVSTLVALLATSRHTPLRPLTYTPLRPLASPVQGDAFYVVFSGAVSIYVEYEMAERGAEGGTHARLLLLRQRERATAMLQSTDKETNRGAPAPSEALEAPRRGSRPREVAAAESISAVGGAAEPTREDAQPTKATHPPSRSGGHQPTGAARRRSSTAGAAQRRSSAAVQAEAGVSGTVGRAEARRASSGVHRGGAGGTEVRSMEEEEEQARSFETIQQPATLCSRGCNPMDSRLQPYASR